MLLNFLFPSLCLHCKQETRYLVCESCSYFFEFLPQRGDFASCFAEIESVSSFCNALGESESIREVAVDFLIIQFSKMGWPEPEIVTSIPRRHFASTKTGEQLASAFARKMGFAYQKLVRRAFGDLPNEENPYFSLRRKIEANRILIIDDRMANKKAMMGVAHLLRTKLRAKTYGLTLTRNFDMAI